MKLWNKDFTLVVIGQIISLFGNAVLRFALPLHILKQSGSAALFGQISALSFLPMILLSPVGGIIADRVNKQRVMVALDFATSALILAYIIVSDYTSAVAIVVAVLMALYAIQGAYSPAVQSSIPLLVETDQLVPANAAVNLVTSLSGMIGPVIGGFLYGAFGLGPVLTVSCACFFLSAVMELFIRIPHLRGKTQGSVWTIARNDMRDSFRFIFKEKTILAKSIFVIFMFNVVFSSMLLIGLPVLLTQSLGIDSGRYGVTQGVMAAGGLVSGILAGILGKRLVIQKVHLSLLLCGFSLFPMGLVLFMNAPVFVAYTVITVMCFFAMAAAMLMQIQMFAFIQTVTPAEIAGKVLSCLMALSVCAQPIGQVIFGQLFERFSAMPWVVVFGSLVLSCAIALYSRKCFCTIGRVPPSNSETILPQWKKDEIAGQKPSY